MNLDSGELRGFRPRTNSNASQQSQQSSKQNFPLLTSDSGLYTCSSNTSDCSLQLESDTDSCNKSRLLKDERLQLALQDVCKLRSELERLTKSEQWYKHELRQQKSTRLNDLERIYTQERKFLQETQRLQKECVRLYEKCNDLERELEKENQELHECHVQYTDAENILDFEKEQQLVLIKDQQQLISVLRKQKRSLLDDLRTLTEEKDAKIMELQSLLADLEFENKVITKKCTQIAKDRLNLESNLKQCDNKLFIVLQEQINLQKSIVDLKEELNTQQQLIKFKESEIERIKHHYTHKIEQEQDLDEVHNLSMKYQAEINAKTIEIIKLKEKLHEMQDKMEDMYKLQQQNELQQRQIGHLNFSIEAYRVELQELKMSEEHKNKQLAELHVAIDQLIKDKELIYKTTVEQQKDFLKVKQNLKSTQEQYQQVQELYKRTQFQLELLEIEQAKGKFQTDKDQEEIEHLRSKLKEFLQQTTDLSKKIQYLESELSRVLKENSQLKQYTEQLQKLIKPLKTNSEDGKHRAHKLFEELDHNSKIEDPQKKNLITDVLCKEKSFPITEYLNKTTDDPDFLKLQQQWEQLQAKLDFFKANQLHFQNHQNLHTYNDSMEKVTAVQTENQQNERLEKEMDFVNLSLQGDKVQENPNRLNEYQDIQESNEGLEKLVIENEIPKKKMCTTETEVLTLQINQDINKRTPICTQMKECLENHIAKVAVLQKILLENDGELYKLEKRLKISEEADDKLEELKLKNKKLKEQLRLEQGSKTELNRKLIQETEKLKNLKQSLKPLDIKERPTKNQAIQCLLTENVSDESSTVKELKQHILQLQQQQRYILEQEDHKKEQRVQFLHQMMDIQNKKIQNLKEHQTDWEDILTSLNNAHALETETRKELELKRLELEELNQVFAEQNEEFRKLEEFTILLEVKRQKEKEELKLTFQQEINVIKQDLYDCQQEVEKQKLINQQLENQNERFQEHITGDYATEVARYKNEIRGLKSRIRAVMDEKENLLENFKKLERETRELKSNKREAILMPDLMDTSINNAVQNIEVLKRNISEDHLRILTKVLEAEYQRKMLRYDEHIHSLLSNLKSFKKSLKANEEKTALLIEEQLKTKGELKDLQKTKRSLEEMSLKYEQSQNTIKELRRSLAFECKNLELPDLGKCSQNNSTTFEVSNLIDDYKKLIQQSAVSTKRPTTSAILDLIQRSNQYVPNLHKLENNVASLRAELQNFLTSYSEKMPGTSFISTGTISVPPSLMDELRAASEGV